MTHSPGTNIKKKNMCFNVDGTDIFVSCRVSNNMVELSASTYLQNDNLRLKQLSDKIREFPCQISLEVYGDGAVIAVRKLTPRQEFSENNMNALLNSLRQCCRFVLSLATE